MNRYTALAAGGFFTLFGILGLIPPLHENWPSDEPMMAVRNGRGFLLGIFPNNFPLSIFYLTAGVWGLFAWRETRHARWYVLAGAGAFGVLAITGLIPQVNSLAGIAPTFGNTALVHIAAALIFILAALLGRRERQPMVDETPAPALGAGAVSRASVAGVPVHGFLAAFPLAFLLGAVATDVAHWWTTLDWYADYDGFWATASVWLIGAGLGSAVLASVAGLVDLRAVKGTRRADLLTIHILSGITVVVLSGVNLAIRFQEHDTGVIPWGIILSVVTAALLVYGGWYAGQVVHRDIISNADESQPDARSVSIGREQSSRSPETG